jgi:Uma2 family endonuclease
VFAMAGGSLEHAIIATNIAGSLSNKLSDKNCRAINSDVRVKVPADPPCRYPDVTVVCGEPMTEKYEPSITGSAGTRLSASLLLNLDAQTLG